ncbi:Glycosyltransferase [Phaffia rhodozyma]|uniref:dolichyl-phosphate beta-glucosyltransferase n=1 Tax=Phaffia rhodozyma TaxID=264483 RepID=A0A0F7SKU9_PHARH|nr:Glycosyltransferase [Phaffia rhodozyma]
MSPSFMDPMILSARQQFSELSPTDTFFFFISLLCPLFLFAYGLLLSLSPSSPEILPNERKYVSSLDPKSLLPLPSTLSSSGRNEPPSLALSIIVPAYNEKLRLPPMLQEVHDWMTDDARTVEEVYGSVGGTGKDRLKNWELIVVDDGSSDGTDLVALEIGRKWELKGWKGSEKRGLGRGELRIISLENNRGKGGAVKHGILHSRGARVLFADADGASTFSSLSLLQNDLDKIEVTLSPSPSSSSNAASATATASSTSDRSGATVRKRGAPNNVNARVASQKDRSYGVAIGSRAHLVETDLVVKRSFVRNCLMHGFHLFVRTLGVRNIRDTQCGFKLFTRDTAGILFERMHLERWSFDVELLVLADYCQLWDPSTMKTKKFPIPIKESPIKWQEIPGSKINLAWDSFCMARDLIILRVYLGVGRWEIPIIDQPRDPREEARGAQDWVREQ